MDKCIGTLYKRAKNVDIKFRIKIWSRHNICHVEDSGIVMEGEDNEADVEQHFDGEFGNDETEWTDIDEEV